MTDLVLDFGGQREAVCIALRKVVGNREVRIMALSKAHEAALTYEAFGPRLDDALELFVKGDFSSVQVHCDEAGSLTAGVYRPRFAGGVLEDWSGSAEGLTIEPFMFDELQSIDGLKYIALSTEESPDFEVPWVTKETFPWRDWRLVAGAMREGDGQWLIRRGVQEMA